MKGNDVSSETQILPAHLEDTVRSIAELHAAHDRRASIYERTIEKLIERLGQPSAAGIIAVIMLLWIGINVFLDRIHRQPFDPAPFAWLQGLVAVAALFMTVLILTSQRRENILAEHRAQLTLELSMVSEQKIAKLIELIIHQRRDNPQLINRVDEEAVAMAKPSDPQALFEAIKETHSELLAEDSTNAL